MWLRVADPAWTDPLDPTWAEARGGRWNPPGLFPVLYLNGDVVTARRQIERLLEGQPASIDDLADDAFTLVAATLPRSQTVADLLTPEALEGVGLPSTYPFDEHGREVPRPACQSIGRSVKDAGLRGVLCPSAAAPEEWGAELAWFPASLRSRARPVWPAPRELAEWRDARNWADLDLDPQPALGNRDGPRREE